MTVLRRTAHAEWIKLWSVRSTWLAVAAAAVLAVGLCVTGTIGTVPPADLAAFDAVGAAFGGLTFAQLAFGVLGVLAVTTEHASGTIVPTLAATPRRGVALLAKLLVTGGVTLVLGEALAFGTFLLGQALLDRHGLAVRLGDPGVLRAVSSAGLYLFVIAMVGLGLGALLRQHAAAIATLFAVVFLAYGAARALETWSYLPSRLLLSNAGDVVGQVHATAAKPRLPSMRMAYADLALYLTLALSLGWFRARRD
ncbi:ABC transporter permease [Dactylosporangium sp. NPDC050588]|uniref:ABC transporter permease n=1 Tax=Dactylosporangium sp. NPDC050588 TaxID=3157211 RepID=UPI0033D4B16C